MTNAMLQTGLFGNLFHDADIAQEFSAAAMLGRMVAFEIAWTQALAATGAVGGPDADQALASLAGFDATRFAAASDRDGLPVPALVAHLRAGLPPAAARAIHTGATSQDVIDTAMVLAGLAVLDCMAARLDAVLAGLCALQSRFGAAPLMARTRMQAALPATVSLRLGAWQRALQAQRDRLPALRAGLGQVQVGGAIGAREVPDAVVQQVAATLGLRAGSVWHTDRSAMVDLGHWFALVSGTLGKVGQDIALMAQQGIEDIALDGGGGSSAMPHKQNPVLAETLVALARHVAGLQGTLAQAMIHEQERSGAAWALEWLTLPAMAEATGAALRHAQGLVGSVRRMGAPG
jgi:3-carboxy-cis,cis-muconate cycloisomerase